MEMARCLGYPGDILGISWGYGDIVSIKDGKNMIKITS